MHRGFTLVETLLAVAIFSLIIGALVTFERDMFRQNSFYQNTLLADQDARRGLRQIVAELRASVSSATGAYPIAEATANSLIFFSDVDKDGSHDRVRYFLDGTALKRGVIEPAGVPVVYDPNTEALEILSDGLTPSSQIIFSYFDRNYAGTSTPMAFPVDISAIRLIKITLKIKESTYSTQVVIRSLKDNL